MSNMILRAARCFVPACGQSRANFAMSRELSNLSRPALAASKRAPACDGDICRVGVSFTDKIEDLADEKRVQLANLKTKFGSRKLGDVTVASAIGGMRGAKALICETSLLDNENGIMFRGHTVKDLLQKLPKPEGSQLPFVEGILYLMLTGELPTLAQVKVVQREIKERMWLPAHVTKVLEAMPIDTHPMTQLVIASAACQTESLFATKYQEGMPKTEYWKPCLDDALALIAKVPIIAGRIYRRSFKDGAYFDPRTDLDWAANYAHMLGFESNEAYEMMRLYLLIHADHEGGNVSSHTSHLVGSALSDPYLAFCASMSGLAGPLHGLANQECLEWLKQLQTQIPEGAEPTPEIIADLARKTLQAGRVIPGYGHAVLRVTDPRFMAQREFCAARFPDDPLFKLCDACYRTIPEVLKATGKVSNPYPNVDAHSGVMLTHYGLKESAYYTVLFGVSRSLGVMSNLVWSRIYQLPIERPGSLTLDKMQEFLTEQQKNASAEG